MTPLSWRQGRGCGAWLRREAFAGKGVDLGQAQRNEPQDGKANRGLNGDVGLPTSAQPTRATRAERLDLLPVACASLTLPRGYPMPKPDT